MIAKQKMHIGLVLPSVPGYSETFFRSKISGLLKNGFQVTLFVKNPKGASNFICPVKVHPQLYDNPLLRTLQSVAILLKMFFLAPKPSMRIIKITLQNGYSKSKAIRAAVIAAAILPEKLDWLHFGFATTALEREFAGKAIGAKTAVSFRGYDVSVYPIKHHNCYKTLWKTLDKVHTISDDLKEVAYNQGLPKSMEVVKITPAIHGQHFTMQREQKEPRDIFNFLTVGRFHWKKGIEYTLEALAILSKNGYRFTYTVVGEGEEMERLTFAAHQLGLSDCVKFIGKVPHDKIPEFMSGADIYIQYSIQEGFCNAVLEAQAAGMLCIVSDAEGLSENVLHNQTGWVVPKRNPRLLAEKIQEVLNMPEAEKEAIREQARERVLREFSIEQQEKAFVEFYKG